MPGWRRIWCTWQWLTFITIIMYHSINLYIHSINPSIHRYGTHICQSFLTHGVCPFSFTQSSPSSNSLWFPNHWRINTGHHTSLSISYEWLWVPCYFLSQLVPLSTNYITDAPSLSYSLFSYVYFNVNEIIVF